MKARSELLSALKVRVNAWDLPKEVVANRLGVTRPRLDDSLQGKMGKFSLDALVRLAAAAGLRPDRLSCCAQGCLCPYRLQSLTPSRPY